MAKRKRRSAPPVQADSNPQSLPRPSFFSNQRFTLTGFYPDDSEEFPTRTPDLAKVLIELVNGCPEAGTALEIICAYALSSGTGDELGFAVVEDESNPQPNTVKLARALLDRTCNLQTYWQIIWRMLAWGDAFGLMEVDTKQMMISGFRLLPSWQLHVIPDESDGLLLNYEQRFSQRDKAIIPPVSLVQWSYNRRYLYGRSLYYEAINDWLKLKDADEDLAEANRSSAVQPNIHMMPPGADDAYKRQYKEDHENRRKAGIIPDIYLLQGADVRKPAGPPGGYPINQMLLNHNMRRARIVMRSKVPPYLLGIDTSYAKEISTQPAIAFVVFVGVVRQLFSVGLRQFINTELALKQIPTQEWAYKLQFPKINVNPWMQAIEEDVNQPGVEDVQDGAGTISEKRMNTRNGNGYAEGDRY
jgi:hypothetical protein